MDYKIEEISIGDKVYFNDNVQSNHDLYWTVIAKTKSNDIIVEINEMGWSEKWSISVNQIYRVLKI